MNLNRPGDASHLPIVEPEDVGLSSQRLALIPPAMQEYINRREVPCVITLIARHGKIAHFEARGMMDVEAKAPVEKDTIFRMYSMTKPITGLATLMLHEEGHFQLDEPISRFLPAFKNPMVIDWEPPRGKQPRADAYGLNLRPAQREITIRDCLTNTTGLPFQRRSPIALFGPLYREALQGSVFLPLDQGTTRFLTMKERVASLAKLPLSFHPGTAWEYGMSISVAGVLIEVVTGKTLEEFFKERIFEPLGMKDSSFHLPKEKINRFATCYALINDAGKWTLQVSDHPETSEKIEGSKICFDGGGEMGGILSTVSDYARFAQLLLNYGDLGGARLLNRKTVELMTRNHTGDLYVNSRGHGWGWGLGVGVRTDLVGTPEVGSIGQYGWGGAASTRYFADPKEDMFGLMFSQVLGARLKPDFTLTDDFERLAYQALA